MNNRWTKEELKAAVEAYVHMHSDEANGIPFIKKQIYSRLSDQFGRTEKSFEYRMQNISYVYSLMGRDWVSGLKPAKNIGSKTASVIEKLISEVEGQIFAPVAGVESQVISHKSNKDLSKPNGIKIPKKNYSNITIYTRDPKVKAWVLKEADGRCELCGSNAPFFTAEENPFLEVHHLRRLVDGGSDTVENAVALCPNCHREMHYGINKRALVNTMYKKLSRLKRE